MSNLVKSTLLKIRKKEKMLEDHHQGDDDAKRISPLRGLNYEDVVSQTKVVRNGLSALKDDHYGIIKNIRSEEDNDDGVDKDLLRMRVENVSRSLERLELGLEESTVILRLHEHFERLEADRSTLRLEMGRVQDENDWLREELANMQAKYSEAALELVGLQEEKKAWQFEEELRKEEKEKENNIRPVTPSKIPVGSWRVEEEKEVNRVMNGGEKPQAKSMIPQGSWRTKAGTAYKKVMEKQELQNGQLSRSKLIGRSNGNLSVAAAGGGGARGKGTYFKLNAAKSMSKIPSR